jgi:hypothetical protein
MRKGWWIVIGSAGALVLAAAIVFPILARTSHPATNVACQSNLRQIAASLSIYTSDYDERLPPAGWAEELRPFYKNEDMLTCPIVSRDRKAKFGYAMNSAVMGIDASKVKDPAKTVVFFETDALGRGVVANLAARNRDRHKGKSHVGYLDIQARAVPKEQEP